MSRIIFPGILAFLFVFLPLSLSGQKIPSPSQVLGYSLGEAFTPHHRVVDYLEHLEVASDRIRLERYGKTVEGRPLLVAYVTSPKNQRRLADIQRNNRIRTGMEVGQVRGDQIPIIWLSYNIHGNEAVSTETAMSLLYQLATAKGDTASWLDQCVIVVDPCLNPDGRDRYVNWYKSVRGAQPNASLIALEHHEPWPGGRYNHYLFDLNRDWCWQTQVESRQRSALYRKWMPHLHADFHEMGLNSPYFFAPAAEPYHAAITAWQRQMQQTMGEALAARFDARGWLYYTEEVFDLLYPSYGDTWPSFQGAAGYTFEQGGSWQAGLVARRDRGDSLTLTDRLNHHLTTSFTVVEVALQQRDRLLREFNAYFARNGSQPSGRYAHYVVKRAGPQSDDALRALTRLLELNSIRYGYAQTDEKKRLLGYDYGSGGEAPFSLEAGDLVVPTIQPQGQLVRVLFEPRTELSDSLTYDLTAWSLPYAYNLPTFATSSRISVDLADSSPTASAYSDPDGQAYAYLVAWESPTDAAFLGALLDQGISVKYTRSPITYNRRTYGRGSLLIPRVGNDRDGKLDWKLRNLSLTHGQQFVPLRSGRIPNAPDLGSSAYVRINPVKVGLLVGPEVRPTAAGALWHCLENDLGLPVTLVHTRSLNGTPLNEFDLVFIPSGHYTEYKNLLLDYASGGGRLVVLDEAVSDFSRGDNDEGPNARPRTALQRTLDKQEQRETLEPIDTEWLYYANRDRLSISSSIPGSIFRVRLDPTHPLAFGYPDYGYFLKRNTDPYPLLTGQNTWNVGRYDENPVVSGFVGAELQTAFDRSLAIGVESYGEGSIVYFPDAPVFRGFWYGGKLLLANAIYFR